MAYFEGNGMTGGYGNGPDIINSCTVNVNKGEIVSIRGREKKDVQVYSAKKGDLINGKPLIILMITIQKYLQ